MNTIIPFDQAAHITKQYPKSNIVLVGGCFDLLHVGHVQFLTHAKNAGDILVVLLESDNSVKNKKGKNRPINIQADRALLLSQLKPVDYVILLPDTTTDETYLKVSKILKPAIIAITAKDIHIAYKQRVAKAVKAKVVEVIPVISDRSTSKLAGFFAKEEL